MATDKVLIFDTTLRDGEQCPGASMTPDEKVRIACALDLLNVDVIEAGFPASSKGDFDGVQKVAAAVKNATVCALARARISDIETAASALTCAAHPRLHTFISTSPLHMKFKLQMEPEDVLAAVSQTVRRARDLCDDVEWSCEDGTRSDFDFLRRCFEAAIRAGATTVNIADTVGYVLPREFHRLVQRLRETVPGMDTVRFSVHCHDDLGLATANSLAAIDAGARQVECTINGIGERAGNAALEEIVMALYTRRQVLNVHTDVRTEHLTRLSQLVSRTTGFAVPPNKAVVGSNAFAHESGIHQHGILMNRGTYEIIEPATVGANGTSLVMGKHSGRHALRARLEALGLQIGENHLQDIFERFKIIADERKSIDDDDLIALATDRERRNSERPMLQTLSINASASGQTQAQVLIRVGTGLRDATGAGSGALEAMSEAIRAAIPHRLTVSHVMLNGLSEIDFPATRASIRLDSLDGRHFTGQSISADPNVAFTKAYLIALGTAAADVSQLSANTSKRESP